MAILSEHEKAVVQEVSFRVVPWQFFTIPIQLCAIPTGWFFNRLLDQRLRVSNYAAGSKLYPPVPDVHVNAVPAVTGCS
jgi:hypothetical protein